MASKKIDIKKKFITNSIPDQHLTHANQLTVKSWNDIVNIIRLQTNDTTEYIENLHKWLIGDSNKGQVYIPEDAASFTQYILDIVQDPTKYINVVDSLDSHSSEAALSANQGRILNEKIKDIGRFLINPAEVEHNVLNLEKYKTENAVGTYTFKYSGKAYQMFIHFNSATDVQQHIYSGTEDGIQNILRIWDGSKWTV